jgi:hypothetical protein
MRIKYAIQVVVGLGITCSGCDPCGLAGSYELPAVLDSPGDFINADRVSVGSLYFVTAQDDSLSISSNGAVLKEGPGMAVLTLEAYQGSVCPPDPSDKLLDFGAAQDRGTAQDPFSFAFKADTSDQALLFLDGKILVLRAQDPAREPAVGVACTPKLRYRPAMLKCD